MPSPKSGTVITDYAAAVKEFKAGTNVSLRTSCMSLVQCRCGSLSFGREKLVENVNAVLKGVYDNRPSGAKDKLWQTVWLGSTRSPSVQIAASEFPDAAKGTKKVKNQRDRMAQKKKIGQM